MKSSLKVDRDARKAMLIAGAQWSYCMVSLERINMKAA